MTSLIDKNTRLVVQGITGSAGAFHAKNCMDFGTNVVAGVTPARAASSLKARSRLRHRGGSQKSHGLQRLHDLCAAALRRRTPLWKPLTLA